VSRHSIPCCFPPYPWSQSSMLFGLARFWFELRC
jgi:hypothetical protein